MQVISDTAFWEGMIMLTFIDAIAGNAFLQRALIVGVLVSLCSALLGISLVLKRY